MKDYIYRIIGATNPGVALIDLQPKKKRKIAKKLKKMLKEIEYMQRMGGLTVVTEGETIITTYHNNSLNRKKTSNKEKVIY